MCFIVLGVSLTLVRVGFDEVAVVVMVVVAFLVVEKRAMLLLSARNR